MTRLFEFIPVNKYIIFIITKLNGNACASSCGGAGKARWITMLNDRAIGFLVRLKKAQYTVESSRRLPQRRLPLDVGQIDCHSLDGRM